VSIGQIRIIAAVAAAGIALTACSSSAGSDRVDAAASHATAPSAKTTTKPSGKPAQRSKTSAPATATRPARPSSTSGGEQPGSTPQDQEPGSTSTPAGARSACLTDAAGDLSAAGSPPAYTDIVGTCLRASGSSVTWTTTLGGEAPSRMSDKETNLALRLALDDGSGPTTYLVAEASPDGWSVRLTRGDSSRDLPGALALDGRTVVVTAPASAVDTHGVAWRAESSWTRSTLLETDYAFDTAPDRGSAAF